MTDLRFNKYRAAVEVLLKGRGRLVDSLADEVLDRTDELLDGTYLFHEFLENQGTRIHFLSLLISQLEQCADELDERRAAAESAAQRIAQRRKPRSRRNPVAGGQAPPREQTSERESPPEES